MAKTRSRTPSQTDLGDKVEGMATQVAAAQTTDSISNYVLTLQAASETGPKKDFYIPVRMAEANATLHQMRLYVTGTLVEVGGQTFSKELATREDKDFAKVLGLELATADGKTREYEYLFVAPDGSKRSVHGDHITFRDGTVSDGTCKLQTILVGGRVHGYSP